MFKNKYKFNPETLKFEAQRGAVVEFIYKKVLPRFASSVVLGITLGVTAVETMPNLLHSPTETKIVAENTKYIQLLNNLNSKVVSLMNEFPRLQNFDDTYRAFFQMPELKEEKLGGIGGTDRYSSLKYYPHSEVMINVESNIDKLVANGAVITKSQNDICKRVTEKAKMTASIPNIQPIAVKDFVRLASEFGYRHHPILDEYRMHAGVDISAAEGTPIYATGDGKVVVSGVQNGYGNVVKIDHGYGYMTVYGHCSKLNVKEGDVVKRGDVIAFVGSTGLSTSPHCHYEVRINDVPQNPINFYKEGLSEDEYQQILDVSRSSVVK